MYDNTSHAILNAFCVWVNSTRRTYRLNMDYCAWYYVIILCDSVCILQYTVYVLLGYDFYNLYCILWRTSIIKDCQFNCDCILYKKYMLNTVLIGKLTMQPSIKKSFCGHLFTNVIVLTSPIWRRKLELRCSADTK